MASNWPDFDLVWEKKLLLFLHEVVLPKRVVAPEAQSPEQVLQKRREKCTLRQAESRKRRAGRSAEAVEETEVGGVLKKSRTGSREASQGAVLSPWNGSSSLPDVSSFSCLLPFALSLLILAFRLPIQIPVAGPSPPKPLSRAMYRRFVPSMMTNVSLDATNIHTREGRP